MLKDVKNYHFSQFLILFFFFLIQKQWLQTVVMGWLTRIYEGYSEEPSQPLTPVSPSNSNAMNDFELKPNSSKTLNKLQQTLTHFLYETYTRTRIDQLFNIIIGKYEKITLAACALLWYQLESPLIRFPKSCSRVIAVK